MAFKIVKLFCSSLQAASDLTFKNHFVSNFLIWQFLDTTFPFTTNKSTFA